MFVCAEVHTAHPAGFVEVSERAFKSLTAEPQQTLAARATDASTIAVHGVAGVGVLLPFASSAIGFGDIAADADGLEIYKRLIAVVALVGDDLLDHRHRVIGHGGDCLELLSRFGQRLLDGRRVALVGALHRDRDDGARLQIDRVLRLVGEMRPAVLHLRDLGVRIVRMRPVVIRALLLAFPIDPRQVGARGCSNARRVDELRQKLLIALAAVSPNDAAQCRVGFQRRRVNADRLPLHQAGRAQALEQPSKDGPMRFEIDQPTRA